MLVRILIGVLTYLLLGMPVSAQEMMIAPDRMPIPAPELESHAYTYVVKEDGSAIVWMRTDGVVMPLEGGEYKLTLPDGQTGEVNAWYRENGCQLYEKDICVRYGLGQWESLEVKVSGREAQVAIPTRKVDKRDAAVPVTLGLTYQLGDVTRQNVWGRQVKISSVVVENMVNYASFGVYMPDGVYVRDKQSGPSGWGQGMMAMMSREMSVDTSPKMLPSTSPLIFDYAGGGEVVRTRNNILPGESYSFTVETATAIWKLYTKELVSGALWVVAIAVVLASLLYMIVGRRSWRWYALVTILLSLLLVLAAGLYMSYQFSFGRGDGGYYPAVMEYKSMDASATSGATTPGILPEPSQSE